MQYCETLIGGAIGSPGGYRCVTFPASCGDTPSCACLLGAACGINCPLCGNTCTMSASGDITTTCYVP
jgi:hypothetical protein